MNTITIDLETTGIPKTGFDYKINFMDYPRILSVGFKVNSEETYEFIINQEGFVVPPEATAINGITQTMCDKSIYKLEEVLITLLNSCQPDLIIGFNIYFDTSILKANVLRLIQEGKLMQFDFERLEEFLHKDKRVDVMRESYKYCSMGKYPKLQDCYFKLFNENFPAHNAKADVDATFRCYTKLKELGIITR